MMEAWLSSSEQITDAQRPIVSITPRLAAYPVVNSTAASAPRQAAMRSSRRLCTGRDPTMSRADPEPVP